MAVISSTFDTGTERWKAGANSVTEWEAEGGNPGGYLHWDDGEAGDSIAFYKAPRAFRGDLSDFVGGTLSYDLWDSGSNNNSERNAVVLTGANGVKLYAAGGRPGTDWTHYSFDFRPGAWVVGSPDGPLATRDDIAGVLADVARFKIRADYGPGLDHGGLDNVTLTSKHADGGAVFGNDVHPALPTGTHFAGSHDAMLHAAVIALA